MPAELASILQTEPMHLIDFQQNLPKKMAERPPLKNLPMEWGCLKKRYEIS